MSPPKLTEYEEERLMRIRQNEEKMKALDLHTLAAAIAPHRKPTVRGVPKRKRLTEELPRRRSSRLQGEAADGSHVHSERPGAIVTMASASEPAAARERYPMGDVPFSSLGVEWLHALEQHTAPVDRARKLPAPSPVGLDKLVSLSLKDEDVAKVVRNSVTHLAFMPDSSALVLAVADKRGGIGLWHIDGSSTAAAVQPPSRTISARKSHGAGAPSPAAAAALGLDGSADADGVEEQGGNCYDGVLAFEDVHREYISGMKWAGGRLFTSSYDGSLRRLEPERSAFALAWGDEGREYSCMDVSADAATAYLGDKDGDLDVFDLRAGKRVHAALSLHHRKLNTVHLDPAGSHLLASASTDGKVCLWDVRKLAARKALATAEHSRGCQAAYLSPDGSARVASTSFDDTVRVWDGRRGMQELASIPHDNQTGRWILPFRAVWAPAGDALVVGNMRRFVDVLSLEAGKLAAQLEGDIMTAIPARNCVHPLLPVLAAGTASGRLHIYR